MSVKWHGEERIAEMEKAEKKGLRAAAMYVQGDAKLRCPIKTGRLRNSIKYKINKDWEAVIGTNVEYAPYVEFGTVKMKAKPYLRPAIDENKDEILYLYQNEFKKFVK